MKKNEVAKSKYYLLIAITLIALITIFFLDPIPQNQSYHLFADSNIYFSIANFVNVVSNLPIIISGLVGFILLLRISKEKTSIIFVKGYTFFFTGVILTGLGSAYYHLSPNNQTLFWDRLPITITFMAFFTIVLAEFISLQLAKKLLYPLLTLGIISVLYWIISENLGVGDLRLYIIVQFFPLILIPYILIAFKSELNIKVHIWLILLVYVLAKLFELMDYQIYSILKIVSGHSLKHIAASIAPIILFFALKNRIQN